MRFRGRTVAAILLVFFGAYLLGGCIYVPTFQLSKEGTDFRKWVGDASSRKPIRPGHADRALVTQILGKPTDSTRDGRTIAYCFRATDGYWVWPICFDAVREYTDYRVRLTFDENDQLVRQEVDKTEIRGAIQWGAYGPGYHFPPLEPKKRKQ